MKKYLFILSFCLSVISCSKEQQPNMFVKGEVKGLKKGTLYLQKQIDTLLVSVDSIQLDGSGVYELSDYQESPEIYYLNLDNDSEKRILFFGDQGEILINTKLDKFMLSAEITGHKNQQLLDEYSEMRRQFHNKNLDLIKAEFEAQGDSLKQDSIVKLSTSLLKRRYFYTTNFAVKHADTEIAPYLALTELFDANISLLDTINQSLTPKIKTSKYGKELAKFVDEIKANN